MSPVDTDIALAGYVLLLMGGCGLAMLWTFACRVFAPLADWSIEDREDDTR